MKLANNKTTLRRPTGSGPGALAMLILLLAGAIAPAANAGEAARAYVVSSFDGRFYFKMVPSGGGVGRAYEVAPGEDLMLWQTQGWYAEDVILSLDGRHVASLSGGQLRVYTVDGPRMVGQVAGDQTLAQLARSGLVLIDDDGSRETIRFGEQDVSATYARKVSSLNQLLPQAGDTVQATRPASASGVVPGSASVTTPVSDMANPGVAVAPQSLADRPSLQSPAPAAPSRIESRSVIPAEVWSCEVIVRASGSLDGQVLRQRGPLRAVALDRAQALCEGVVGTGSRNPLGICEAGNCTVE